MRRKLIKPVRAPLFSFFPRTQVWDAPYYWVFVAEALFVGFVRAWCYCMMTLVFILSIPVRLAHGLIFLSDLLFIIVNFWSITFSYIVFAGNFLACV
jgi:hypothetical protein